MAPIPVAVGAGPRRILLAEKRQRRLDHGVWRTRSARRFDRLACSRSVGVLSSPALDLPASAGEAEQRSRTRAIGQIPVPCAKTPPCASLDHSHNHADLRFRSCRRVDAAHSSGQSIECQGAPDRPRAARGLGRGFRRGFSSCSPSPRRAIAACKRETAHLARIMVQGARALVVAFSAISTGFEPARRQRPAIPRFLPRPRSSASAPARRPESPRTVNSSISERTSASGSHRAIFRSIAPAWPADAVAQRSEQSAQRGLVAMPTFHAPLGGDFRRCRVVRATPGRDRVRRAPNLRRRRACFRASPQPRHFPGVRFRRNVA